MTDRPIHPGLAWMREDPAASPWLDSLPRMVDEVAERWSLRIGDPYAYATSSLVLRAMTADGTRAALKMAWPHREAVHEAAALAAWDGEGAVRLLAHDPDRNAMLLERAEPGTSLRELAEDDALDAFEELLVRLWLPARPPFTALADEAAWWAGSLPRAWREAGEPFERRLVDAALIVLSELPPSQGELVLVHQDLHADNILRARRQPWLAIDPKPLLAEREFSISAIVRGDELGRGPQHVRRRLERLTSDLGLDRERARLWAFAHTLAWAVDADRAIALSEQVEVARWLLDG